MKGAEVSHIHGWKALTHTHIPGIVHWQHLPARGHSSHKPALPESYCVRGGGVMLLLVSCCAITASFFPKKTKYRMNNLNIPHTPDHLIEVWLIICWVYFTPSSVLYKSYSHCQNESLTSIVGHTVQHQVGLFSSFIFTTWLKSLKWDLKFMFNRITGQTMVW